MREVGQFSLACFIFSLALLRSLQCFKDIPECKTDVNLECAVDDVMFAGFYDLFTHLLRFFCETTLFTIVFEEICADVAPTSNYNVQFMTCCIDECTTISLICFVVSLRIIRSLWCFRDIPEFGIVRIELRVHRIIFDMMRQQTSKHR